VWNYCERKVLSFFFLFVCLIVLSHTSNFFSYLVAVTITGDRTANLDMCLALTAFSSESSFTCHTYCDTGPPFLRSYPKDPWFSLLNAVLLAKKQLLPILNFLGLTRPVSRAGLEPTTSRMLSKSKSIKKFNVIHIVRMTYYNSENIFREIQQFEYILLRFEANLDFP
jgi:hypothetical protein